MKKMRLLLVVAVLALLFVACGDKHTHKASAEWKNDDTHHWYPCASCEDGVLNKEEHIFDNACDADCNKCGFQRTPAEHTYDNACDAGCNVCGAERIPTAHQFDNVDDYACNVCGYERKPGEHIYDHACDTDCNLCGEVRVPADHVYDHACDADCNICKAVRVPADHVYDHACDTTCNVCGYARPAITHTYASQYLSDKNGHWQECLICGHTSQSQIHVYDRQSAQAQFLKSPASGTSKAVYYVSCTCGAKGAETFESDKKPANITGIQNISKVYDGKPVAAPTFDMDSNGAVSIQYKPKGAKDIRFTATAPTEAGDYVVRIKVGETASYAGETVTKNFSITRRTLTEVKLTKVYDGEAVLGPVKLTQDNCVGLAEGDEVIITLALNTCNVGAYATAVTQQTGADSANYWISIADVSASVKPKALTGTISVKAEYTGYRTFTYAISTKNGRVEKDTLILEVEADSRGLGVREVLSVRLSPNQEYNYTIKQSQVKLEVIPKTVTVRLPDTMEKTADGTVTMEYAVPYGYLCAGDKLTLKFDIPSAEAGEYTKVKPANLSWDNDNYKVEISNKSITVVVADASAPETPVPWDTEEDIEDIQPRT